MEFKVGDEVRRKQEHLSSANWNTKTINEGKDPRGIFKISEIDDKQYLGFENFESESVAWNSGRFELVNSKSLHKTMEKKIYQVLVVNKKTGDVEKDEVVVAVNEQSAILKAFGVDAENVFIKTTEEGSYTEDKPVTAVLVKEIKTPKAQ